MSRFTERHLDPGSRLGEILFGLIMVLTVTLAAGFSVAEGRRGAGSSEANFVFAVTVNF
jgi:hypothetical protein